MPVSNKDNPQDQAAEVQKIADKAAAEVAKVADVQEDVKVEITELPPTGALVATRTRRVQFGEHTFDLVEGEPVEVNPDHVAEWVRLGWVHYA